MAASDILAIAVAKILIDKRGFKANNSPGWQQALFTIGTWLRGRREVTMNADSAVLSDQCMENIRNEEIYRSEVRASLAKKAGWERYWELLNSPIVILAFSTLALGILSFTFRSYLESATRLRDDKELCRKLTLELATRGFVFIEGIDVLRTQVKRMDAASMERPATEIATELTVLFQELDGSGSPVYEEFQKRGLLSLLRQLKDLLAANGQLFPGTSKSRKNFLLAEYQIRELRSLVRDCKRDPRPSVLSPTLDRINTLFMHEAFGQAIISPPEPIWPGE
jgi:hypothetical protein